MSSTTNLASDASNSTNTGTNVSNAINSSSTTNINSSKSTSESTVPTKTVHPVCLSTFAPTGVELSAWAYLNVPRPASHHNSHNHNHLPTKQNNKQQNFKAFPNLVTAHSNCLRIYVVDPSTGKLLLAASYENLAGTIVSLQVIPNGAGKRIIRSNDDTSIGVNGTNHHRRQHVLIENYDGLLLGFAGHPRLSIVYPPFVTSAIQYGAHVNNNKNDNNLDTKSYHQHYFSGDSEWSGILTASSIIDLTPALLDRCCGSVSPLEQDLICSISSSPFTYHHQQEQQQHSLHERYSELDDHIPTVVVILGNGVAVASFQLPKESICSSSSSSISSSSTSYVSSWWRTATEPYLLPLPSLSLHLPMNSKHTLASFPTASAFANAFTSSSVVNTSIHSSSANPSGGTTTSTTNSNTLSSSATMQNVKFTHGFGDIISCTFLPSYTEPTVCILHSNPNRNGGRTWSGRLGHKSTSTKCPLTLTAISISIEQKRSVMLWSLRDVIPADAFQLYTHHPSRNSGKTSSSSCSTDSFHYRKNTGGVLVVGVNEILYVDTFGHVLTCIAVNGWVRSTASYTLFQKEYIQPNPSPLPKLNIQLDGSCLSFMTDNVALISLRNGSLYCLELHMDAITANHSHSIYEGNNNSYTRTKCFSLSPLGMKLGALGMISSLSVLPLMCLPHKVRSSLYGSLTKGDGENVSTDDNYIIHKLLTKEEDVQSKKEENEPSTVISNNTIQNKIEPMNSSVQDIVNNSTSLGLIFCGSRFGDSSLLSYSLQDSITLVPIANENEKEKNDDDNNAKEDRGVRKRKINDITENVDNDDENDPMSPAALDGKQDQALEVPIKSEGLEEITTQVMNDEGSMKLLSEEDILLREEKELYALEPNKDTIRNQSILVSDDDSNNTIDDEIKSLFPTGIASKLLPRPQIKSMAICQAVDVLDSLTGLGPLGPSCTGPLASSLDSFNGNGDDANNGMAIPITGGGTTTSIYPCGYGTSGGLAVLTAPGLNYSSTILSEVDCRNVKSTFICKKLGYIIMTKSEEHSGCILLRHHIDEKENLQPQIVEVDLDMICGERDENQMDEDIPSFSSVRDILGRMTILNVKEFTCDGTFAEPHILLLVRYESTYAIVILSTHLDSFTVVHTSIIGENDEPNSARRDHLVSSSVMETLDETKIGSNEFAISLACVWSSGNASIFAIINIDHTKWITKEVILESNFKNEVQLNPDLHDNYYTMFYASDKIVAIDMFLASENIFGDEFDRHEPTKSEESPGSHPKQEDIHFDKDDFELYGEDEMGGEKLMDSTPQISSMNMPPSRYNTLGGYISSSGLSNVQKPFLAVCRQSGQLQLLDMTNLFDTDMRKSFSSENLSKKCLASLYGCGLGVSSIDNSSPNKRKPMHHDCLTTELRFFFSGPTNIGANLDFLRSLCLVVENSLGDIYLYTASKSPATGQLMFRRVVIGDIVTRSSKEEEKHNIKLKRKGISGDQVRSAAVIIHRPNRLYRFQSISGQDGLFAATHRPLWFLSERGAPSIIYHRSRHAAPGCSLPIVGFCSGVSCGDNDSNFGFITVHERLGRIGSQRLTLHQGLSDIFTQHGLLPGGGLGINKIPLGVTVRQIEFVDDISVSSATHPIYALLVCREIENEHADLNDDDGTKAAERMIAKEEREKEKIRRQVEADLGGFDVEQEWVQEIERDDCFEVEKRYGRAPPIMSQVYEIWLMDAAGWKVVDSYQLEEYEHGLSLKVMYLSDISPDASSDEKDQNDGKIPDKSLFLVVGTSIIDDDGEDISSRGRVLLFDMRRSEEESRVEINFLYDKDILLGPVTSLRCLSSENKNRLLVGAGAEITVEQWGQEKLTQVGFFHANMQVVDIVLFKSFLLLIDAYDSLHFLVWRESDKSLTLLAKDYEPTCVYAAGLLSRGGAVAFVSHDDRQNLSFFSYAPSDPAARGGNKLVCRGDFHLGIQTVSFSSHFCRSSLLINSATVQSTIVALKQQGTMYGKSDDDQRFGLHYGSTDGGFGSIVPVNESIYWRLTALQSVMSNALESDCALSHRAWRLYRRTPRRGGCRSNDRKKGVIDGDLVSKFVNLSIAEQEDISSAIGSTVELVMDNLLDIACSSMVI